MFIAIYVFAVFAKRAEVETSVANAMGHTNFAECAAKFINNHSQYMQYQYNDTPHFIHRNYTSQITFHGCQEMCGRGAQYYKWSEISTTITTWTLPILGIILLAPFESNAFWGTVYTLARWIGNPIASIACTFWNIKVTGKCALLVDLAVPYREPRGPLHHQSSSFAQVRDSFYILACMNQFAINPHIDTDESRQTGETLVRVAVFGKLLHHAGTNEPFLVASRKELAEGLRITRKRGVVPVLISIFWFIFSLVLCVQTALTDIGTNLTAHDLALGLLLGWFPVLFMSFIVDRNPPNAEVVRLSLNCLIKDVADGFDDAISRDAYIRNPAMPGEGLNKKVDIITRLHNLHPEVKTNFFTDFAGQGRSRWHYGVAHPILADLELNYITGIGRGWYSDNIETLSALVLGDTYKRGLIWFDRRQIWQITSSTIIVLGTAIGAFFLSYFEPTVGLGCRSGGYMVFMILAVFLMIMELISWWLIAKANTLPSSCMNGLVAVISHLRKATDFVDENMVRLWLRIPSFYNRIQDEEDYLLECLQLRKRYRSEWRTREWADRCLFRPIEVANLAWISYIAMAQTIGSYETCSCQSSNWGANGGYVDLNQYLISKSSYLNVTWKGSTSFALVIMGLALIYISFEWCLQSHLSTANYQHAIEGLRWTRRFRRLTFPYRFLYDAVIRIFKKERRSVFWTYKPTNSHHNNRHAIDQGDEMSELHNRIDASQNVTSLPGINSSPGMFVFDEFQVPVQDLDNPGTLLQVPASDLGCDSGEDSGQSRRGSQSRLLRNNEFTTGVAEPHDASNI